MDTTKELPTLLSLCSGYGGIERGLELAGFRHRIIAYVEIEAFAIANLVAKMEEGKLAPSPIWSNLKTLPVEPFRGRVDLLTGGYPCQPFSAAGKRAGKDDPRHLWPYISDIIRAVRPVRCFFENVEGHISLGLREVISDLERLGYKTAWGIFSATEVGAPHRRKRVYILADSQGIERRQGYQNSTGVDERSGEGKIHITTGLRESGRSTELADSISAGLQGHAEHQSNHASRQAHSVPHGHSASEGSDGRRGATWTPEPSVGRVVDGCANRVDRVRLLGNGVVPQTAALAWVTLEKQLEKAGRGNEPGRLE